MAPSCYLCTLEGLGLCHDHLERCRARAEEFGITLGQAAADLRKELEEQQHDNHEAA
jgi:hypothetical protein